MTVKAKGVPGRAGQSAPVADRFQRPPRMLQLRADDRNLIAARFHDFLAKQTCRTLDRPLLISAEFAKVCTCHPLVSLGQYRLRGVGEPQEIFTPAPRAPF